MPYLRFAVLHRLLCRTGRGCCVSSAVPSFAMTFRIPLFLRHQQQAVALAECQTAVRHQVAVAAFYHDDQCRGRQMHVFQRVAVCKHAVRHDVLTEFRTQFFGDFHSETVAVRRQGSGESEPAGNPWDAGTLDDEGDDGDEEDNVEDEVRPLDACYHGICGEDDGDGSAKTYPRYEDA